MQKRRCGRGIGWLRVTTLLDHDATAPARSRIEPGPHRFSLPPPPPARGDPRRRGRGRRGLPAPVTRPCRARAPTTARGRWAGATAPSGPTTGSSAHPTVHDWRCGTSRATGPTPRRSCCPTVGAAATRSGFRSPDGSGNRVTGSSSTTNGATVRARAAPLPWPSTPWPHDLEAVLEATDVRDVVLAGHSMGGMTIMSLATHRPEVAQGAGQGDGARRHGRRRTSVIARAQALSGPAP